MSLSVYALAGTKHRSQVIVSPIQKVSTGRQFARDYSIVEEGWKLSGKRTPSDATETGCRGKNPSDYRESVIMLYENYSAAITVSI